MRGKGKMTKVNGLISGEEHCRLDERWKELLKNAMSDLNFSARAYHRILKVARTIADLASSDSIASDHLLEALSYRNLDRTVLL